ncbi:MAG: polyketide synthase [Streptomyces oryziradicis]|nr:polyketide synthase [Actinacidiphila oryziradicis]
MLAERIAAAPPAAGPLSAPQRTAPLLVPPGHSAGPVSVLRAGGDLPPLFLAHAAGGPPSVYRGLAERLGPAQPCYGLERIEELPDVEAEAARYAEAVRRTHPRGPYRLGGWSFGGFLAYETARILTAEGEDVEAVVLIDSIRPLPAPDVAPEEAARRRFTDFAAYVPRTYGKRRPGAALPRHPARTAHRARSPLRARGPRPRLGRAVPGPDGGARRRAPPVAAREKQLPINLWGDPILQAANWSAHNPRSRAEGLRGTGLYVSAGSGLSGGVSADQLLPQYLESAVRPSTDSFVQELQRLGIPATPHLYSGGTHSWTYWQTEFRTSWPLLAAGLGLSTF